MRSIILGLILAGLTWGQSSGANVVNIVAFASASTASTGLKVSANLQNIGQTAHSLNVTLSNDTLSAGSTIALFIQGSSDGTNYFNISPAPILSAQSSLGSTQVFTVTGFNAYPFIRAALVFTVTGGSTTYKANYFGTSAPATVNSDSLANNVNMQSVGVTMNNTANNSIASSSNSLSGIAVYGLSVNLASTATAFRLFCLNSNVTILTIPTVAAAINEELPMGSKPYAYCGLGDQVAYTLAGTGASGLSLYFRYE